MAIKVENSVTTAIAHSNASGKLVKREANASQTKGRKLNSREPRFRVKISSDVLHPRTVGPARSVQPRSLVHGQHPTVAHMYTLRGRALYSSRGRDRRAARILLCALRMCQRHRDYQTAMFSSRTTSNVTGEWRWPPIRMRMDSIHVQFKQNKTKRGSENN